MSIVSNIGLRDFAEQIAKERNISYGEALFIARRHMAAEEVPSTVTRNSGSPLRDQQQSTTPQPSAVRQAVISGLQAVQWNPPDVAIMEWVATGGAQAINQSVREVSSRLSALGMGPQIIAALTAEMKNYLTRTLVPDGTTLLLSNVIAQTGDHVQQTYAAALANKTDTQVWNEGERFDEHGRVLVIKGGNIPIRRGSVELSERASQIARTRGVNFGEALRLARREMASDVVDSQQLGQAVITALKTALAAIFEGKQQKVMNSMDVLKAVEAVSKSLVSMNIGDLRQINDALRSSLDESIDGVISAGQVDSIISKAAAAVQKAYAQQLAS